MNTENNKLEMNDAKVNEFGDKTGGKRAELTFKVLTGLLAVGAIAGVFYHFAGCGKIVEKAPQNNAQVLKVQQQNTK